jgi:DNA replication protein DnaC
MEVQKKLISEVQSGEMYGHSVLYCGPSRTGKTVLASALLQRMIHLYVTEGFFSCFRGCHPPIYRVNADRWLEQYEEWKYFDFKSERPRPTRPEPNPESVSKLLDRWAEKQTEPDQRRDCPDDFPPVLILEEIDKFNGTDSKCRALESLLNTVFELRGMIVSTSNLSKAEIKERFPDWLYRRLVESSVDHKIRVRDLHDVVNAKKPHSKRLRA